MPNHANQSHKNRSSKAVANQLTPKIGGSTSSPFVDNRPETKRLARIQAMMRNKPRANLASQWQVLPQEAAFQMKTDSAPLQSQAYLEDARVLDQETGRLGSKASSPNRTISSVDGTVQRKILVNGSEYTGSAESSNAVSEAVEDEFIRYYESEQEAEDHLDRQAPVPFGLIKPRALWYRIPFLSKEFFVFGESHAAVRGARVKEASNIQKPILDERIQGWTVGQQAPSVGDVGVDENSSKLLRALEAWNPQAFQQKGSSPAQSPPLPEIPRGEASTRDTERGTHRLIVYGEGGKEELWTPRGEQQAPQSTHDFENEVLAAIEGLFELVFATEIQQGTLDNYGRNVAKSWGYFKTKAWTGHQAALNIQINVREFLLAATRAKVSEEYAKLQSAHSDVTRTEDTSSWTADDYRNEFMFVQILKAAAAGTFAFATIGDDHLTELKERLAGERVPFVSRADFFDRYSRDAVDTRSIAYANSPIFRENQRLVLWLKGAFLEYPNLQQFHLDMLTAEDLGEFVLKGTVSKWDVGDVEASGSEFNKPVLHQFLKDLEKVYPNGEQFIPDLTFAEIGEFLTEEKITRLDAMEEH